MPKTTTSPKQAAAPQWAQELGLTDKQAMFVDEYIVDFSGAAAAIRAGYSKKGAGQQANALLKNPKVQQGIKLRTQDRIQRVELDQDFALERLRDELTARLSELYDENGALLQVHEWYAVRRSHTYSLALDLRFRGFFVLWGVSRWELQASFWQWCLVVRTGSGIGRLS